MCSLLLLRRSTTLIGQGASGIPATEAQQPQESARSQTKRRKRDEDKATLYGTEYTTPTTQSVAKLTLKEQVDAYIKTTKLNDTDKDPLVDFWLKKEDDWPELCQYAVMTLVMQPTETAAERRFSQAGNIVTDSRSSLRPHTLNDLFMVYANMSLFDDTSIDVVTKPVHVVLEDD